MHSLVLTILVSGAAEMMLGPKTSDVQVPCAAWLNTKADTAGVIQVALSADKNGKGPEGYDGYPVAVKLADNRARACRFAGQLKLADKMLGVYEIRPENRIDNCLLLVDLGKKAVLHDRKGVCGKALCNGMVLDNLTFPFDAKTKTCTAKRPEGQ
jgi:hypothetical protein